MQTHNNRPGARRPRPSPHHVARFEPVTTHNLFVRGKPPHKRRGEGLSRALGAHTRPALHSPHQVGVLDGCVDRAHPRRRQHQRDQLVDPKPLAAVLAGSRQAAGHPQKCPSSLHLRLLAGPPAQGRPHPLPSCAALLGQPQMGVAWDGKQLHVQRVENKTADGGQAQGFPWVPVTVPVRDTEMRDLDVVFSHSEPALIEGEGDEASMVFGFGAAQPKTDRPRDTLLTVDLARSFSAGSLVIVREKGFSGDPEGVLWCCYPFIFMDDSGHPVVVHEGGNCAFAVSLWTGERTKLCDNIFTTKVNGRLARIDMNIPFIFF
ncbi:hypothetical protein Pelo_18812 [Pelomyxa schiedti]|nr:hypothetical protein Pelo_18812 [Pelomyxa schiedti]